MKRAAVTATIITVVAIAAYLTLGRRHVGAASTPTATPAIAAPGAGPDPSGSAPPPATPSQTGKVTTPQLDRRRRDALAQAIARTRQAQAVRARAQSGPAVAGTPPTPATATPATLSKDDIRAGVRELLPLLGQCFDLELARDPTLGAHRVIAEFTIDSEAEVGTIVTMGEIDIPGPLGQSQDFRDCLGATLESVVLPPLGDGGTVGVRYPFEFSPGDDEAPAGDDPRARPPTPPAPAPARRSPA